MDKDPYYKLRVVGTASSIGALLAGIVLAVVFFKALRASTPPCQTAAVPSDFPLGGARFLSLHSEDSPGVLS